MNQLTGILISYFVIVTSQSHADQTCRRLGQVYGLVCPGGSSEVVPSPMPGAKGDVGPKGEKGDAGEVDDDEVNEILQSRIQRVMDDQALKFSRLMDLLNEANEKIRQLENRTEHCPISYDGKCFWVEARYESEISFQEGKSICEAKGGQPGNIYSEDHYLVVLGYLRNFAGVARANHPLLMYIWLGMEYRSSTNTFHLTNGEVAPFLRWFPGYPKRENCCNMGMDARVEWDSVYQNMYNPPPTWTRRGILCEK